MNTLLRIALPVLVLPTLAALPMLASAQLVGNVALTTNYKFRGQDQDMLGKNDYAKTGAFKPAVQGGLDYAFGDSGFYVGNWNSSVNWLKGNSLESDIYGGYKFKAGPFDMDVGALTYLYPGNSSGNTTELYGSAGYTSEAIGSFTLKYSHTVSKDYFGYAGNKAGSGLKGTNTGYLNLAYSKEIVPKGHAEGGGRLHEHVQRHPQPGLQELCRLQRGRFLRLRQRPVAGRLGARRQQAELVPRREQPGRGLRASAPSARRRTRRTRLASSSR
jgi:uncharacterized protein (TIGR02001 family)